MSMVAEDAAGLFVPHVPEDVQPGEILAYESAVDISLEAAGIGVHEGRVLTTKQPGNGVRLFRNEGRFYFRVSSSFANWHLRVIQLTEEEAALYTPREP